VKYWHFVKLMDHGHKITLEVASRPARIALISEEVAEKNMSLDDIVDHVVDTITDRR